MWVKDKYNFRKEAVAHFVRPVDTKFERTVAERGDSWFTFSGPVLYTIESMCGMISRAEYSKTEFHDFKEPPPGAPRCKRCEAALSRMTEEEIEEMMNRTPLIETLPHDRVSMSLEMLEPTTGKVIGTLIISGNGE